MIYKAPFTAISKALYTALKYDNDIEWFDSSVPIFEIEEYFKDRSEFEYGIFGTSTADCDANKDAINWRGSIGLEIYSNYKGRKRIAEKLEHFLNFMSEDGYQAMSQSLSNDGYKLIELTVGTLTINMPMYGDKGVWQSGTTTLTFILEQGDL